jgi:hypothetical protein
VAAWANVRFLFEALFMLFFASLFSLAIASPPNLDAAHETGASAPGDAAAVLFVEDYVRLADVDGASRDAAMMATLFKKSVGIPDASVKVTTGGTRSRMRSTVQSAAKKVKNEGTLWVYFSGYGLVHNGEWLLLGKDTLRDGSTAVRDGIKLNEIYEWSKRSAIGKVVLILDASFGGNHRDGSRVISPPPPSPPRFRAPEDERIVVWMADTRARTAPHYRAADHGMFTYLVSGAMRGWADGALGDIPDGLLTLGELQRFVRLHTHALGTAHASNESELSAQAEWALVSGKMESGPGQASWSVLAKVEQNLQMVQAIGRYRSRSRAAYEMATSMDDPEVRRESLEAFLKVFGRPEIVIRSSMWLPEVDSALRELNGAGEIQVPVAEIGEPVVASVSAVPESTSTPVAVVAPTPAPPPKVIELPPPPGLPTTCENLLSLEPFSLMGQLTQDLWDCLEKRLSSSEQTLQIKISRVLIMDAEARRDKDRTLMLMRRHLNEIGRSDPDLCFKYALRLFKLGLDRQEEVLIWVGAALENKQEWTKATYKRRLFSLYQLQGETSNKLWIHWAAKYVEDRSEESKEQAEKWRNMTKQYSLEWLNYAKISTQAVKRARNLCITAAGTSEFCEAEAEE